MLGDVAYKYNMGFSSEVEIKVEKLIMMCLQMNVIHRRKQFVNLLFLFFFFNLSFSN